MTEILVHHGGALTTVQDYGRFGYQAFGVSVSGAMDRHSLKEANWLVGNESAEAGLEITLTGPDLEFASQTVIAITGADLGATLNREPLMRYETIRVLAGDRLRFHSLRSGLRAYLAIAGGIQVKELMGSRSTFLRAQMGGFQGRALKAGDRLPIMTPKPALEKRRIRDPHFKNFTVFPTIRFIAGPETHHFDQETLARFLAAEFKLSTECDRMGIRLEGPPVVPFKGSDIISSPVSPGTIQVTSNGTPIVLMADAQTSGGYCRIGQLVSADRSLMAQMKPGDRVRFKEVSLDQA